MKTNNLHIYALAVLAMVFWGVSYVWTKIVFDFYQPVTVMFIRLSISSLLMYGIFKIQGKTQSINRSDYPAFVILSFFSPFCYFIGENFGLLYVTPTIASVIIATIPIFTPILGFLAFRERLNLINIAGFLISFCGILIMVLDNSFRFSASPKGLFFLFFAVASALINVIFLKKLAARYNSFTIIRTQNLLGALFFLPLFLIFELKEVIYIKPSPAALGSLLALAVFGSTLAFMFFTSAVRTLGVARTAIFTNLIPVITAIASWIILKEHIDQGKLLGMAIVISGLFMTQIKHLRRRKQNDQE